MNIPAIPRPTREEVRTGAFWRGLGLILSPMSGITDFPFRTLCRMKGCRFAVTEFVSAEALARVNEKTLEMLEGCQHEPGISIQIFGKRPEAMVAAAELVLERFQPDILDVNIGCPAPKIVKGGGGVALMCEPDALRETLAALRRALSGPLTCKIRSGWDEDTINAVEIAKMAEDVGVDAIAVHPRTRTQLYRGPAVWPVIAAVKEAVSIPVIGNGDVQSWEDCDRMIEETGCDGVSVGRGAIGNPWVFAPRGTPAPDLEERVRTVQQHLDLMVSHKGEYRGVREMRKHFSNYFKALPNIREFRNSLVLMESKQEIHDALEAFLQAPGSFGKSDEEEPVEAA